ncbi:DUF6588 family protein [Daejeonella oryzae]|uniref:DUF6588 family protein n=1 Tax=Daejeonella oryzae TaxID=1122943 RepID=UPI000401595C|nr:DUF6588 family protein [Daejeonella oryzae]
MGKQLFRSSIFILFLFSSNSVFSQGKVSGLIKAGPGDATKLTQAYLNPLFKGLGIGLNSGWNNTAESKNTARFEFRFGLTGALIPQEDKFFDVTKIGLSNHIRPANNSSPLAPTMAGNKTSAPQLDVFDDNNQKIESFTLPQGQNLPLIPAPQLQGTVGLPNGIDITLRAVPKVSLGNDFGSLSMLGAGIKLEILPLIIGKTLDKISPVDIAVAVGFSQLNYQLPLDVRAPEGSVPKDAEQNQDFNNQMIDAKFSGINAELILSKKLLFFTPFISAGYNTSQTNAKLKGNYPIVTGATGFVGQRTYTTFTNPVDINQNDVSGFRGNIGFQLNIAVLRIYSSYTVGDYNAFNFGLGVGLGK